MTGLRNALFDMELFVLDERVIVYVGLVHELYDISLMEREELLKRRGESADIRTMDTNNAILQGCATVLKMEHTERLGYAKTTAIAQ